MSATPDEHTLAAAEVDERLERLRVLEAVHDAAESRTQIARVEELSDAYHLQVGERDVVVAYLLEITAKANGDARSARLPGTGRSTGPPRARRR